MYLVYMNTIDHPITKHNVFTAKKNLDSLNSKLSINFDKEKPFDSREILL